MRILSQNPLSRP